LASKRPPNILWVCTDQQRFDTIGALGNRHVSTPVVDQLVERGTCFTHAYCQSPICTPSRASFLTGMYPSAVHVMGNGNECFPDSAPPLVSRLLADAGYDCGLVGKLHLASAFGRVEPRTDDGYGFWKYSHAPRDDWPEGHDYADWVRQQGADLGELTRHSDGVPAPLHQSTWCAEMARQFMGAPRPDDQPWMLSVNIYDPHPPFNPPAEYRAMFDAAAMPGPHFRDSDLAHQRWLEAAGIDFQSKVASPHELDIRNPVVPASPRQGGGEEDSVAVGADVAQRRDAATLQAAYYAMIKLIDDSLGQMLAALQQSGQRRDTIVLFTSDHGETLGDHGLIAKGCRFYEGLVRVPLVFHAPELVRQGVVDDSLVELTDLAPTLLDLAGVDIPQHMQGRSLATRLAHEGECTHRDFVRCEYYDALDEPDGTLATMFRDRRHKLVVYHGKSVGELYDLEQDPHEHENLWDAPAHQPLKLDLMRRSFDASMEAMDRGPRRIGPM
jgi:arylsulfatase